MLVLVDNLIGGKEIRPGYVVRHELIDAVVGHSIKLFTNINFQHLPYLQLLSIFPSQKIVLPSDHKALTSKVMSNMQFISDMSQIN